MLPKYEAVPNAGVCPNCNSARFRRKDRLTFHCDDCGKDSHLVSHYSTVLVVRDAYSAKS